jgi:hypothetical protein
MTTATSEVSSVQYRPVLGAWPHDFMSGDSLSLLKPLRPVLVKSTIRPNWYCAWGWIEEEINADNEIQQGRTVGPVNSIDELLHSLGLE